MALVCVWTIGVAAEELHYRVAAPELACVVENIEKYQALGADPVFVVTKSCPPEDDASLLSQLVNEVPNPEFSGEDALDGFLALTAQDLKCLAGLEVPREGGAVRLYLGSCRLEVE